MAASSPIPIPIPTPTPTAAFETGNNTDISKQEPEILLPPEKKLESDVTSDEDPYIKIPSDDYDDDDDDDEDDEYNSDDEFYDDGLHEMTKKEANRYYKQIHESQGFDVDPLPNVFGLGLIVQANLNNYYEDYEYFTKFAIDNYNANHESPKIEFVKIVKANVQVACPLNYYITFEAKDVSDDLIKTYQALVYRGILREESEVDFVRLKPGSN